MGQTEISSLLKKYTMSVDFKGNKTSMFQNLVHGVQMSPVSVTAAINSEHIKFQGKAFKETALIIPFSAIKTIIISSYARLLPTASHMFNMPSKTFFINLTVKLNNEFTFSFETRDFDEIKDFFKKLTDYEIEIEDKANLKDILCTKDEDEIDKYLSDNEKEISELLDIPVIRSNYNLK